MASVTMRDLRNHGGEVVDRVMNADRLTITRLGRPVAELGPVPKPGPDAAALLARCVPRFRVEKHERLLTREELFRLGEALRAAPEKRLAPTHAAAAIRLLMLTGCRRNEILGLRWDDLNFDTGEMRLPDTKTGTRMVPLTPAVARVFDGLARTPGNPWVFPGKKTGTRLVNLDDSWDRVRKRAGLEDVRLHDLRHSFASRALALGENLPMIGKLLGHTQVQTIARYAHPERHSHKVAAIRISDSLQVDMDTPPNVFPHS